MTAYSKQLIIFDLLGTLTNGNSPIDPGLAQLLIKLIAIKKVAILSGSSYPQFDTLLLRVLPHGTDNFSNLFLLPTSGTRLYAWKGSWNEQYAEHLSPQEKEKIMMGINSALKQSPSMQATRAYGQLMEDRGSQMTFSALGMNAPQELKSAWDPTQEKRRAFVTLLQSQLPEFDIRIGGTTSVDITKRGINKGYGIRRLEQYLPIPLENMVFVGATLFHGGNDYPAKATGIDCISVSGPEETKKLIESWLSLTK